MKCKCDNCGAIADSEELKTLCEVHHLGERLDPGSEVPAGECVECGAFSYIEAAPAGDLFRKAREVDRAILLLRQARDILRACECPNACDAVRRALKSTEGAQRNQRARDWAAENGKARRTIKRAKGAARPVRPWADSIAALQLLRVPA